MGLCTAILLLSNSVESKRKNKQKNANSNTPAFTEDQCFCGVRHNSTKKLNLDLFGSKVAGQILNYVDQSISKFNALNLTSDLVVAATGNRSKKNNPYQYNSGDFLKNLAEKNGNGVSMNPNGKRQKNLRITYLKTVLFTKDQNNSKTMKMEFMMGRRVAFHILIKMIDLNKKQFDISIVRDPYVPENPQKTRDERKKYPEGFTSNKIFRSLSHFDKNQLEVDVCRMMYVALNQYVTKEFDTSIQSQIVRFGKTRRSFQNAIGCQQKVFFRERYSTDYLGDLVQTYYYKLDKNNHVRAKLSPPDMENYHMVNQELDSGDEALTRKVTKSQIEFFNDKSDSEESSEIQSSEVVEENTLTRKNMTVKDVDMDQSSNFEQSSQNSSSKIEERSEASKSQKVDVYDLRSRQVPKTNPTSLKDLVHILKDSEQSSTYIEKELERSHRTSQETSSQSSSMQSESGIEMARNHAKVPSNSMGKSNAATDLMKKVMLSKFKNDLDKIKGAENSQNEIAKPKKRKRVIVLIESIECSKCKNDLETEVFIRLLKNKSYMI